MKQEKCTDLFHPFLTIFSHLFPVFQAPAFIVYSGCVSIFILLFFILETVLLLECAGAGVETPLLFGMRSLTAFPCTVCLLLVPGLMCVCARSFQLFFSRIPIHPSPFQLSTNLFHKAFLQPFHFIFWGKRSFLYFFLFTSFFTYSHSV